MMQQKDSMCLFFFPPQIQLKIRKSQSGLGAGATMSLDSLTVNRTKSQKNWEKARERFADSCQPETPSPKTQKSTPPTPWVRAAAEEEVTTNTQTAVNTDGQSQE